MVVSLLLRVFPSTVLRIVVGQKRFVRGNFGKLVSYWDGHIGEWALDEYTLKNIYALVTE